MDEKNIANPKELREKYSTDEATSHCILQGAKHYTAVVSSFKRGDVIGGTITLETDIPMIIRQLPEEGAGMVKQVFSDEWNCNNAGGCRNFGTYDVNPAYCIRVR